MQLITRLIIEEEGAEATEYALVLGLVALGIVVGAKALGTSINTALTTLGKSVCTNTGGTGC